MASVRAVLAQEAEAAKEAKAAAAATGGWGFGGVMHQIHIEDPVDLGSTPTDSADQLAIL